MRAACYADRVTAVAGDLTAPRPRAYDRGAGIGWRRRSTMIVHCAASVSFGLSLEAGARDQRRGNAPDARARPPGAGTRRARAVRPGLDGVRSRHPRGPVLRERPRRRAELQQLLRAVEVRVRATRALANPELPFTILRPSIVVGDRNSGWTSAFNVLYWPLRALARGLFPAVPATPSAPVDVVSIDYVADGIYELCESAGRGPPDLPPHCRHRGEHDRRDRGARERLFPAPAPRLLSPVEFMSADHGVARSMLEEGAMYFPYFSVATTFDDAFARATSSRLGSASRRCAST